MKLKIEKAVSYFRGDLNCAQAVLTAYAEELDITPEIAQSVSCGFGAGMGRLQETCGAVTGAFMVLGLYNSKRSRDNKERKEKTYTMIQKFSEKFNALHDSMDCKSLINCNLRTEEGQQYFRENKLGEKICEKCVADSVRIIEELTTGIK